MASFSCKSNGKLLRISVFWEVFVGRVKAQRNIIFQIMAIQWNFVGVRPKLVSSIMDGGGLAVDYTPVQYRF